MTVDVPEITPRELAGKLAAGEPLTLLDVRQPWEHAYCRIPGDTPLPLGELPARVDELDREAAIVTYCKVGERSAWAASFLLQNGFRNVRNLRGGIYGWAEEVDPSVIP